MVRLSPASPDSAASTNAPIPRLGYQPALDGVRALAVLAVMLYHGGASWARGGYLGVDVFFVLSGFLITSLLLSEWHATDRIGVVAFYARRFRRLVPALAVVLLFVLAYALAIAPESDMSSLRGDVVATLAYFTNWRFIFQHVGYFDAFALPSPLKHTWSLAVEEQWYLIWPMLVVLMLRLARGSAKPLRFVLGVVLTLCIMSTLLTAALFTPGGDPSRVYYGTDTRAQELLAGAAFAIVCMLAGRWEISRRFRGLLATAGVASTVVVIGMCVRTGERSDWLYQGGLLLFSFVVVLVIAAAIQPTGPVRAMFSPAPVRWIGAISYGLYLWHWPIYVYLNPARTGLSNPSLLIVRFALTFAAATASFYLLERPIREQRLSRSLLLTVGSATAVVMVGGLFLLSAAAPTPISATTVRRGQQDFGQDKTPVIDPGIARIVVTGDSVAYTLTYGYDPATHPELRLTGRTTFGCNLFDGDRIDPSGFINDGGEWCAGWRQDREGWLQSESPAAVVVLAGVWETYDRMIDGHRLAFGTPAFDAWFGADLDALAAQFSRHGARTVILTSPCYRRTGVNDVDLPENSDRRIDHLNDLYREAADRSAGTISVIDLHRFICPNDNFLETRDNVSLRSADGIHFSDTGARLTLDWLVPQIEAILKG